MIKRFSKEEIIKAGKDIDRSGEINEESIIHLLEIYKEMKNI